MSAGGHVSQTFNALFPEDVDLSHYINNSLTQKFKELSIKDATLNFR